MTTYFGFAVADSMFPSTCSVSRRPLTVEEVKTRLADGAEMCLNPSHTSTIVAATKRYGLFLTIPQTAPNVSLKSGDTVIVMSVRGLPRLEGRHEYTQEEIDKASFTFGEWTVTSVPAPPSEEQKEFTYSDGIGNRGRRTQLIVGKEGIIATFEGKSIPGVVAVVKSDYTKNGKWSHSTYTLRLAAGSWSHIEKQSWEEGEYFHGCSSLASAVDVLRSAGYTGSQEVATTFLREKFPKTTERIEKVEKDLSSL